MKNQPDGGRASAVGYDDQNPLSAVIVRRTGLCNNAGDLLGCDVAVRRLCGEHGGGGWRRRHRLKRELNGLGQEPAVDAEVGARDEAAGAIAGQENTGTDEFVRFTEAAHGGVVPDVAGARAGRAIFVEQQLAVLFGGEESGRDGVDADTARGPFSSEEERNVEDGGLGGGIGDDTRERQVGGDAGDIDDAAASAARHGRAEFLARDEHAATEVQIEILLPVGQGDLLEGLLGRDGDFRGVATCGVDQDAGRPEGGFQFFVCFGQAAARQRVGGKVGGRAPLGLDAFDSSLPAFGVPAQHGDFGAGGG